jgi:hypothetical protein
LEPHRNVLEEVWSTGGRLDFFVGWFLDEDTGDALDWRILEKMSQLRIELQLNIYAPDASSFNKLEGAVLQAIGEQIAGDPEAVASGDARAFQLQLSSVTVRGRRNTGAGFFTELEAARSSEPIKSENIGKCIGRHQRLPRPHDVRPLHEGWIPQLPGRGCDSR